MTPPADATIIELDPHVLLSIGLIGFAMVVALIGIALPAKKIK